MDGIGEPVARLKAAFLGRQIDKRRAGFSRGGSDDVVGAGRCAEGGDIEVERRMPRRDFDRGVCSGAGRAHSPYEDRPQAACTRRTTVTSMPSGTGLSAMASANSS